MTVKYDREKTLRDAIAAAGALTDMNVVPWKEKVKEEQGSFSRRRCHLITMCDSGATLVDGFIGDQIAHGNPFHAWGEATADSIEGEVVISFHHRGLWVDVTEIKIFYANEA